MIELAHVQSPDDLRLRRLYELIERTIPDPDQRDDWDDFRAYASVGWTGRGCRVVVLEQAGRVVAGAVGQAFEAEGVGLALYLAVEPDMRGRGLGRWVLDALELAMGPGCRWTLGENNDPRHADLLPVDGMPVAERMRAFHRLGFGRVEFDYVQPPVSDEQTAVGYLMLVVRASGGGEGAPTSLAAAALAGVLRNYLAWVDMLKLATGRYIRDAMLAELARMDSVRVQPLLGDR